MNCYNTQSIRVNRLRCTLHFLYNPGPTARWSLMSKSPITSSLGEFPGYWDWLWNPGLPPMLVSIAFSTSPFISRCFSFTLHLPLDFISISTLRPTYLHPFGRPFTCSLFRRVSRLGTDTGIRSCGPRGGTDVCMKQKSRFKFLLWPGFEPRTLQSTGRERYHKTTARLLCSIRVMTNDI